MKIPGINSWLKTWGIIFLFIIAKLVFHFLTNTNYELHRDSFLYIEQGKHLAWGYASTPPFIGVVASLARTIFGDTAFGIRFFPAIIGAISILLIGTMVKEMGGKSMAIVLACLAFLVSPAYLRSNTLFQPVSFNQFFWLLTAFFFFRLIRTKKPFYWILIGIVSGLGILNKHSILIFQASVFLALLSLPLRKWFRTWYPWVGSLISLLIILPHIFWQIEHGWPLIRHMKELSETQLLHVRIDLFIMEQFLMNLPGVVIWLVGLYYVLFRREAEKYQIFGLTFLYTIGIMLFLRGKAYYTLGLYAILFVYGGYYLEILFRDRRRYVNYIIIFLMLAIAISAIPISLPVLKPADYISFMEKRGMGKTQRWEDGELHELPQDYADMIGWQELAGIVGNTYQHLTPEQQSRCSIFANNYGEAGAVNFYGARYNLPPVISYNDSFLLWAPDEIKADYLIRIGHSDNLTELYYHVEVVDRITTRYARQEGTPVYLCSAPKININTFYQKELAERRAH